ncbi:MAG: hypothetical protein MUF43_09880 [Flavobacterium sp.]|jgi:hypothetical protein|nr:hypothetical protein [Flavobacterium sp.]
MRISFYILILSSLFSCNYFQKEQADNAVARVGNDFLYRSDIEGLVPAGVSGKDSIEIVKTFIDNWATQKLLSEAASLNLSNAKVQELNDLVAQYKSDLLTNAYLEELVIRQIDTTVTSEEIVNFYNQNKQFFKNPSELVKLRYINLVKENPKFDKIRTKFNSFTPKDRNELQQQAIQFKSYAFNDSIWVDINQVYQKLPFINADNKERFISNGMSYQFPDSTTIWLVKVKEVLPKNSPTPLQFLKPTIKQVILNTRKKELLKKVETEITNDAIKEKKYEIYK